MVLVATSVPFCELSLSLFDTGESFWQFAGLLELVHFLYDVVATEPIQLFICLDRIGCVTGDDPVCRVVNRRDQFCCLLPAAFPSLDQRNCFPCHPLRWG